MSACSSSNRVKISNLQYYNLLYLAAHAATYMQRPLLLYVAASTAYHCLPYPYRALAPSCRLWQPMAASRSLWYPVAPSGTL